MTVGPQLAYQDMVEVLDAELQALMGVVEGLTPEQWSRETRLNLGTRPGWDVHTLVTHIDISLNMLPEVVAAPAEGPPQATRISHFQFDTAKFPPIVDRIAREAAAGHTPSSITAKLGETVETTIRLARETPPDHVGVAFFGNMRLDDVLPTRVLEAAVHGLDLSDALGMTPHLTSEALAVTAHLMDEVFYHRHAGVRLPDLEDSLVFVEIACGRRTYDDARFPFFR